MIGRNPNEGQNIPLKWSIFEKSLLQFLKKMKIFYKYEEISSLYFTLDIVDIQKSSQMRVILLHLALFAVSLPVINARASYLTYDSVEG